MSLEYEPTEVELRKRIKSTSYGFPEDSERSLCLWRTRKCRSFYHGVLAGTKKGSVRKVRPPPSRLTASRASARAFLS